MPTPGYTIFLVSGMLITGACNTLLIKMQDQQCVKNCDTDNPKYFEQPVIQTMCMFMGEVLCLLVSLGVQFYKKRKLTRDDLDLHPDDERLITNSNNKPHLRGVATLVLWIPALLDICGTTLMNVGLIYIVASVYQMLRGAVVIFTGIFSVLILKRKLSKNQWISLFLVMLGVFIVGASNIIAKPEIEVETNNSTSTDNGTIVGNENGGEADDDGESVTALNILGIAMVIGGQIFAALQFIMEEKVMSRWRVGPLKTVGLEGSFGLFTVIAASPFLYLFIGRYDQDGFFNVLEGVNQVLTTGYPLLLSTIGSVFSIGCFNWFGLSITNAISATSRTTIDTCRTILIWFISLSFGWESFNWYQVAGFLVLIYGTFIFNNIITFSCRFVKPGDRNVNENSSLISNRSPNIIKDDNCDNNYDIKEDIYESI
ncbi:hypothetical protein BCR32DRAFT_295442 [Anaeromyces robustus]|uniref:Integral membrane protein n=1 Tax=Anaeromyces robustus TaxID=1754192 RepID=A0A1Y1WX13_9FUNG|nr:hypothetical protein BCR32DRAFT_295442 [Anaeromyces robustus]|eukprot:ORX77746.1 hypothetical protein BCR32DRAFT_295442 [Anaeromyces robustus]